MDRKGHMKAKCVEWLILCLKFPGLIWKKNIKKLAGTFTGNIVDGYQDMFNAQAVKLIEKLKTEGSEPFDVLEKYLAYTTLESICRMLWVC